MSKFSDMAAGARGAHAHYFADDVVLNEAGLAPQTVPAVVGKIRTETRTDEHGRQQRVSFRDVRFVTRLDVRHDATVTIDGVTWSIEEFTKRTASGLQVRLHRTQTHEISRTNYRGKP
jgi:hypothetical protein